jgi:hypothetical protein
LIHILLIWVCAAKPEFFEYSFFTTSVILACPVWAHKARPLLDMEFVILVEAEVANIIFSYWIQIVQNYHQQMVQL